MGTPNNAQWSLLLDIVEGDYEMRTGQFRGHNGRERVPRKWEEAAEELNQLCSEHSGGGIKSGPQWKEAFVNLKSRARKAYASKKKYIMGTGGGPQISDQELGISAIYERCSNIVGTVSATGRTSVPSPLELQSQKENLHRNNAYGKRLERPEQRIPVGFTPPHKKFYTSNNYSPKYRGTWERSGGHSSPGGRYRQHDSAFRDNNSSHVGSSGRRHEYEVSMMSPRSNSMYSGSRRRDEASSSTNGCNDRTDVGNRGREAHSTGIASSYKNSREEWDTEIDAPSTSRNERGPAKRLQYRSHSPAELSFQPEPESVNVIDIDGVDPLPAQEDVPAENTSVNKESLNSLADLVRALQESVDTLKSSVDNNSAMLIKNTEALSLLTTL